MDFIFCAAEVATPIARFLQPDFTYGHELAPMGITSVLEQLASKLKKVLMKGGWRDRVHGSRGSPCRELSLVSAGRLLVWCVFVCSWASWLS